MKKLFYQIMAIALLLPLFQCERAEVEPKQSTATKIDYEQLSRNRNKGFTYAPELETYQVSVDEVRAKIRTYLNGENSRTDYSIQEAVWYIEALPNYFEGNASVNYKKLEITEHYYYFGNDENATISSSQIDNFSASIQAQAISDKEAVQCAENEKNTILVNVSPMVDTNGDIYLKATVGTGVQCYLPPNDEDPPEPMADYDPCDLSISPFSWTSTENEGTCGDGPQSNRFDNAAKVIEDRINSFDDDIDSCPMRYAFPTENGFFVNSSISPEIFANFPFYNAFLNPNDDNEVDQWGNQIFDGYRDYWLLESWADQAYPLVTCLDPDEMEYYRTGAYSVIYWYMNGNAPEYNESPEGKTFEMCKMFGSVLLAPDGVGNLIHGIQIHYGDYVP